MVLTTSLKNQQFPYVFLHLPFSRPAGLKAPTGFLLLQRSSGSCAGLGPGVGSAAQGKHGALGLMLSSKGNKGGGVVVFKGE